MGFTALGGAALARAGFAPQGRMFGFNKKPCTGFMLKTAHKVGLPSLRVRASTASSTQKPVSVAVLGASGHTGAEIVRLLANHSQFHIKLMTADRKAGKQFGSIFPHLITQDLPNLVAIKDADFSDIDAVFCCLPHGAAIPAPFPLIFHVNTSFIHQDNALEFD